MFFMLGLAVFSRHCLAEEELAIITQRSNELNTVSLEQLKLVYLRKLMLDSNGMRWIPINLPSANELRKAFSLALFNKLPDEQEAYWNEQYFQGVMPPQVLASEEAVLRFVTITPGAIGYVWLHSVDDRVRVLKVISLAPKN
jgi:ABC-type phosphate transport system substrate-binding protein